MNTQARLDRHAVLAWVSSDLLILTPCKEEAAGLADDVTQVDDDDKRRVYRNLTLAWYGWLFGQMNKAKAAHESGRLKPEAWQRLRTRFAVVHRVALETYGADNINRELATGRHVSPPRLDRCPPRPHSWGAAA